MFDISDLKKVINQFSPIHVVSTRLASRAMLSRFAWIPILLILAVLPVAFYFISTKLIDKVVPHLFIFVVHLCSSLIIVYFLYRIFLERKKDIEALRSSEERFRALVVASSNAIYRMNPDWSKMEYLSGVGFTEIAEKPDLDWLQKFIPVQDQPEILAAINRAVSTRSTLQIEHRAIKSDGSVGWALSKAVPFVDKNGNINEWFGTSTDITIRKQAELSLKRRTEELDATNKELESFSYSVSHDLRSQLNAMKCLSQVLLEKYSGDFSKDVEDFIRKISASTDKMTQIINGMLSLARLTRESMTCHHIDLVPIINAVFYELKQTDPYRNVEICIDPEMTAYADARLMHIALTNLIENAWKYSSKNPQARIEIGTRTDGNEKVFFIRDNGAGFNMKHAGKLFEPFQRLHSENHFPGTGIGLATVSKIIHRHGGKIWAESIVGEGATFYFTISLQPILLPEKSTDHSRFTLDQHMNLLPKEQHSFQ